ncbi:hypothetical protein V1272_001092 [Bradyrhizobium sp. AZCC 1708]
MPSIIVHGSYGTSRMTELENGPCDGPHWSNCLLRASSLINLLLA